MLPAANSLLNIAAFVVLAMMAAYVLVLILDSMRTATAVARGVEAEREYLQARVASLAARRKFEEERAKHGWNGWRKFEVWKKTAECDGVVSLYLRPNDRKPLPPYQPGQFLTFRVHLPDRRALAESVRCYSLSDCANPEHYRVTVKNLPAANRERSVSRFFHEHLKEGDILDVKAPSGAFCLDLTKHSPVVLIGGGIGLTPLLAMVNAIVQSGSTREVVLFYGVRHGGEHAMREHLAGMAREHPNIRLVTTYSQPRSQDIRSRDYDLPGRLDLATLKSVLPSNNYDFYMCGPPGLMAAMFDELRGWGVPERNIHFEAFGPATVKKVHAAEIIEEDASASVAVRFAKSGKELLWSPQAGSILDLAEANGVAIASGCRAGNCGTCVTAVKSGSVMYLHVPGQVPEAGSCLACVAAPTEALVLDA